MALRGALGRAGVAVADRMRAAARALPRRAAHWVLQWAERGLRGAEGPPGDAQLDGARAGVGPDPDRSRNVDLVRTWSQAWLRDPERPSGPCEAALAEASPAQTDPRLAALVADEVSLEGALLEGRDGRAGAVTFDLEPSS